MSNTLMAFLALMLMMLFSLNQNRVIVDSQREAASVELEVLANGVAAQEMQYVASKPFDAYMSQIDPLSPDLNLLTHPNYFPMGAAQDETEFLEDFNMVQPYTVDIPLGDSTGGELPMLYTFKVQAAVIYVDDQGNESATPTWIKEVTLYIDQEVPEGHQAILQRPIIKKRRFSPSWGA